MINEQIQPGGARLKQPENSINQFCRACESFQAAVVGSLLISKLYEDIPFVSKAVSNAIIYPFIQNRGFFSLLKLL